MIKNKTLIKYINWCFIPIYDPASAVICCTCNAQDFSWGFWNKVPIVSLNDYIVQVLTRKHTGDKLSQWTIVK